ncbi:MULTISPECIES: Trm112 family protein [unclassified Aminobacter]|jgi:uncharacterized protein YbaR (Trm112 family)|uniref:Trm112 family protein n=1 Tax=unclassified Aminobacter TaxID=2644704 RepID=UPI000464A98B|nr:MULTISPECIES: Trm112 family protein [unclassified Aminobacter]TWG65615.1 hypothetical protein L610_001300001040 [Aminobacter sp. J44]TWH36325.1 hypothetical protein L611_001000000700 [Aminobacter sp. J15]
MTAKEGAREVPQARSGGRGSVDPKLLEMLACPLTKGRLIWKPETGELISPVAKLAYPVRDGVPIMLPSEARTLNEDELGK